MDDSLQFSLQRPSYPFVFSSLLNPSIASLQHIATIVLGSALRHFDPTVINP